MAEPVITVRVQAEDFDVASETAALLAHVDGAGAVASFLGIVRSEAARPIAALTLEHYPAMTRASLLGSAREAARRFGLLGCTLIHRVGRLLPGAQIVLVLCAASHRQAALDGTGYLIDWLKTDAPFWKSEERPDGSASWVEARPEDTEAASRW